METTRSERQGAEWPHNLSLVALFLLPCLLCGGNEDFFFAPASHQYSTGGIELHEVGQEDRRGPLKGHGDPRSWRPQELEPLGAGDSPWLMNS